MMSMLFVCDFTIEGVFLICSRSIEGFYIVYLKAAKVSALFAFLSTMCTRLLGRGCYLVVS